MIEIRTVKGWKFQVLNVTEGWIVSSYDICAWCDKVVGVGEFVLVVQEDGRVEKFAMHPKCLPPEVKAARAFALGLAQVQYNHSPQRA